MSGNDFRDVGDTELGKAFGAGLHGGPIGTATHDDGDQWLGFLRGFCRGLGGGHAEAYDSNAKGARRWPRGVLTHAGSALRAHFGAPGEKAGHTYRWLLYLERWDGPVGKPTQR